MLRRAVAEERQSDTVVPLELRRIRGAESDRQTGADDRERADQVREKSVKCIEPPTPLQQPVERPISSAKHASIGIPRASACPWPR